MMKQLSYILMISMIAMGILATVTMAYIRSLDVDIPG